MPELREDKRGCSQITQWEQKKLGEGGKLSALFVFSEVFFGGTGRTSRRHFPMRGCRKQTPGGAISCLCCFAFRLWG